MRNYKLVFYIILFGYCNRTIAQFNPLVSKDFAVPESIEYEHFKLRMLTVNDVVKDYDAVMSSSKELQKMFPTWEGWPKDLTLEQDLVDLGWHQAEFKMRSSFTYTVVREWMEYYLTK
jgi:heme oxygenase